MNTRDDVVSLHLVALVKLNEEFRKLDKEIEDLKCTVEAERRCNESLREELWNEKQKNNTSNE